MNKSCSQWFFTIWVLFFGITLGSNLAVRSDYQGMLPAFVVFGGGLIIYGAMSILNPSKRK